MNEPFRHQVLGLQGERLRQSFFGFKPIADYLKTSLRNLQEAGPRAIAQWTLVPEAHEEPSSGVRVQLEDSSAADGVGGHIATFFDDDVRFVSDGWTTDGRSKRIRIIDRDLDASTLTLDSQPTNALLAIPPNTYTVERQRQAVRQLQEKPHRDLLPLIELVLPFEERRWPLVEPAEVAKWRILTDDARPGADEQRRFVRTALATPDFALLEGPPGSGKTTAICELILQAIDRGQRVLLCASTHVAVDNVLESIALNPHVADEPVIPVRVGDRFRCAPPLRHLVLDHRVATEQQRMLEHLRTQPEPTFSQQLLGEVIDANRASVQALILDAANLVCGTTIGILQHPTIRERASDATEPIFDLMIVDEASKTTLQEFLVPAILAKRWVLVGDVRQLAPYAEPADLAANLLPALHSTGMPLERADLHRLVVSDGIDSEGSWTDDELAQRWADALAWRLITRHQYGTSAVPQGLLDDIERMIPVDVAERVEAMTAVALPSMIESLQSGVGGQDRRRRASVLTGGMPPEVLESRHVRLTRQHRMHPEISAFPRTHVYDDEALHDTPDIGSARSWTYRRYSRRIAWVDARARPGREHDAGRDEADHVGRELEAFLTWAAEQPSEGTWEVALLSFYREQVRELRRVLSGIVGGAQASSNLVTIGESTGATVRLSIGTVDTFQGREADLVLLSIGNQRLTHFTRSPNRINVAITRARYQLVVVGNRQRIGADRAGGLLGLLAKEVPDVIVWEPGT